MDERMTERNEELEITLQRLLGALWHRAWLIGLVAVICAVVAFVGTKMFITPQYQSSAMFYVNNDSRGAGDTASGISGISSGDIDASKNLVDSYIVILNTRETLNDIADYSGVERTSSELAGMISASAVNSTEIIRVVVTSPDPAEAETIANAIADILPDRIASIIEGSSAKVVDYAVAATSPSSPNYIKNALLGFALGFMLVAGIVVLQEIFDVTIREDEDISKSCNHPILASVPDMMAPSKGGYDYGYDRKNRKKSAGAVHAKQPVLIGSGVSFAAAESYKLLRTKLQFSFADENASHVIGVSSSLSGEGKSLSAVNLAYSLSQLDKKVILLDCDMRRPTLAEKLKIQKHPGLSNYLTGQNRLEELIQNCGIRREETAFHVITAGQNPPNPIELLSSARMAAVLESLRKVYDYIILDLPPVSEVSDALAVAKETDGILLVVRQHYCNRLVLNDTIRQFEFVDAKILGVIYNCTTEGRGRYGKGYYRRYYKGDYNRASKKYEGAYLNASRSAGKPAPKRPDSEKK